MTQTLDDFIETGFQQLKFYSKYQMIWAGPNKWKCPYCKNNDNIKTNQNWIKDRLFKCNNCEKIIEGIGRAWWKIND